MQRLTRNWQREGLRVGLVPTMGYLHPGHLSLVKHARRIIGTDGKIVVSIYVNPTQFSPQEDFSRYPRDLKRDIALCRSAGVDVVFAPTDNQMYPKNGSGPFSTYVTEETLSQCMEGKSRPTHFRGVTTVVAKLFNIVAPEVAVFGAKDYQQAAVVKRMVRDLNFHIKIHVAPIFREPDGVAMSSRNKYLEGDRRAQARVLWRSIGRIRAELQKNSRTKTASELRLAVEKIVEHESAARLDYVEFFDPATLAPVAKVKPGTHMALAVFIGKTRLIDNARL
jgi:pantoate--beta-alanine ligase